MVTAPIVLLIAVATNPDGVAVATEAAAACLQALPPGARTVVRTVPSAPAEGEVSDAVTAVGANVTVLVTWRDADQLVSNLRVRSTSPVDLKVRQTERNIVFNARDLPAERGRALGLVIASILEEDWGGAGGTPGRTSTPPVVAGGGAVNAAAPAPVAKPQEPPRAAPLPWALEANVITAVNAQDNFDDTIGGLIALRRSVTRRLALRVGLGFRVADLDGADATARTTLGSLGVVWASGAFVEGRRVGFAVRADLLGAHEEIKSGGDDQGDAGRWTAGADLVGQIGIGLSAGTSLLLSGGVEGFVSSLSVTDEEAETIPRGRVIFELGVLSRF